MLILLHSNMKSLDKDLILIGRQKRMSNKDLKACWNLSVIPRLSETFFRFTLQQLRTLASLWTSQMFSKRPACAALTESNLWP